MTPNPASKLVVQNLRKSFRSQRSAEPIQVFDDISFEVYPSEFISLVGPSGCGKTTFLRILDGLIPRDEGEILLDGKAVIKPKFGVKIAKYVKFHAQQHSENHVNLSIPNTSLCK
jgi:ABC-type sugar transport system ATPase subunit